MILPKLRDSQDWYSATLKKLVANLIMVLTRRGMDTAENHPQQYSCNLKMALHQIDPAPSWEDEDPNDSDRTLLWEPSPGWSFVVEGDPLWDSDQDNFKSQWKDPPEIEQLRLAAASGELAAVQRIFTSQWVDKVEAERIDKCLFASSLVEAIQHDDVSIASYLLSNCVSLNISYFTMAAEMKKYSMLQLFLDMGWDINAPIERTQPPPLS